MQLNTRHRRESAWVRTMSLASGKVLEDAYKHVVAGHAASGRRSCPPPLLPGRCTFREGRRHGRLAGGVHDRDGRSIYPGLRYVFWAERDRRTALYETYVN